MLYNLVEDEDLYVGDVGCVVGNEVVPSSLCGIIVPRFKHELMYRLDCNYDSFYALSFRANANESFLTISYSFMVIFRR